MVVDDPTGPGDPQVPGGPRVSSDPIEPDGSVGTMAALAARVRALTRRPGRVILGIAGAPGSGKSTLAARLVADAESAGIPAALVPMDGFHLAQSELRRLGALDRKGAIDTFDADGYLALLRRLRKPGTATVYAPRFHRDIEEPVAGAIPVPPSIRLVVTEGNYLLVPDGPWSEARGLLDAVWYVDLDERERLRRLTDRHIAFGRDPDEAWVRARGTDQVNADLIEVTAHRADLIIRLVG